MIYFAAILFLKSYLALIHHFKRGKQFLVFVSLLSEYRLNKMSTTIFFRFILWEYW